MSGEMPDAPPTKSEIEEALRLGFPTDALDVSDRQWAELRELYLRALHELIAAREDTERLEWMLLHSYCPVIYNDKPIAPQLAECRAAIDAARKEAQCPTK